ncbi:unnamed protein product [Lepeophtheirus salmonis]|uniref:(salmon louse) hypothetical protein n=1 Tax=Lepeophtheirus salmonis TaxID=72036 RepID=A0A7R8CHF4_LEPSM|nr:unnamed protein product [Lepeophtheirus salmonis]CAF2819598.1 unnamed protein product [Lepeophtheirus salmonis]
MSSQFRIFQINLHHAKLNCVSVTLIMRLLSSRNLFLNIIQTFSSPEVKLHLLWEAQEEGHAYKLTSEPPFGVFCIPETIIKNLLACHFLGGELDPDPDIVRDAFPVSLLEESNSLDGIITLEKLETSALSFHSFKITGPDGISPRVLKHISIKMLEYLCLLFVGSVRLTDIPFVWGEMRGIFLHKPGKNCMLSQSICAPKFVKFCSSNTTSDSSMYNKSSIRVNQTFLISTPDLRSCRVLKKSKIL